MGRGEQPRHSLPPLDSQPTHTRVGTCSSIVPASNSVYMSYIAVVQTLGFEAEVRGGMPEDSRSTAYLEIQRVFSESSISSDPDREHSEYAVVPYER
jgi:hypothetical protein